MTLEATATDVALAISLVVKAKEIALMIQTACLGWSVEAHTVLKTKDSVTERNAVGPFLQNSNRVIFCPLSSY